MTRAIILLSMLTSLLVIVATTELEAVNDYYSTELVGVVP